MTTEKIITPVKILTYANPTFSSSRRCFSAKTPTVTEKTRNLINYHMNLGKNIQDSFRNELNSIGKSLNARQVSSEKQQQAADMMSLEEIELDACSPKSSMQRQQKQQAGKEINSSQVKTCVSFVKVSISPGWSNILILG